jgi:hypothetical protein
MSSLHRLGLLHLLLASASVALPALAEAGPTAADQATASQAEYRKAHEAARAHNWVEARRILLGLWSKAKTYDVAASLSEAEFALGHPAASAQYMDYALRNVTPNESATTVANMKSAIEKIRPRVGGVKLTVSEPSAIVTVDGARVEYDPKIEIFLEPGRRVLEAAVGERKVTKTVDAVASETQSIELELPQPASTPPPPPVAESSPPTPVKADTADSGLKPRTIALIAGGGVAVVGVGMGLGFGLASNSSESDVEDYQRKLGANGCQGGASAVASCASLRDAGESQRRNAHLANIGYGIAALGLATVGVALLWPHSGDAASARAPNVELRWAGNGLFLDGKF